MKLLEMRAMGRCGSLGKQLRQVLAAEKLNKSCITAETRRKALQTPPASISRHNKMLNSQ